MPTSVIVKGYGFGAANRLISHGNKALRPCPAIGDVHMVHYMEVELWHEDLLEYAGSRPWVTSWTYCVDNEVIWK